MIKTIIRPDFAERILARYGLNGHWSQPPAELFLLRLPEEPADGREPPIQTINNLYHLYRCTTENNIWNLRIRLNFPLRVLAGSLRGKAAAGAWQRTVTTQILSGMEGRAAPGMQPWLHRASGDKAGAVQPQAGLPQATARASRLIWGTLSPSLFTPGVRYAHAPAAKSGGRAGMGLPVHPGALRATEGRRIIGQAPRPEISPTKPVSPWQRVLLRLWRREMAQPAALPFPRSTGREAVPHTADPAATTPAPAAGFAGTGVWQLSVARYFHRIPATHWIHETAYIASAHESHQPPHGALVPTGTCIHPQGGQAAAAGFPAAVAQAYREPPSLINPVWLRFAFPTPAGPAEATAMRTVRQPFGHNFGLSATAGIPAAPSPRTAPLNQMQYSLPAGSAAPSAWAALSARTAVAAAVHPQEFSAQFRPEGWGTNIPASSRILPGTRAPLPPPLSPASGSPSHTVAYGGLPVAAVPYGLPLASVQPPGSTLREKGGLRPTPPTRPPGDRAMPNPRHYTVGRPHPAGLVHSAKPTHPSTPFLTGSRLPLTGQPVREWAADSSAALHRRFAPGGVSTAGASLAGSFPAAVQMLSAPPVGSSPASLPFSHLPLAQAPPHVSPQAATVPGAAIVLRKAPAHRREESPPAPDSGGDISFIKRTAAGDSRPQEVTRTVNLAVNAPGAASTVDMAALAETDVEGQAQVIAERVYSVLERRLRSERMRKGLL